MAAIAFALLCALGSCAGPPDPAPQTRIDAPAAAHIVHVVRRGWHAGIVIERAALVALGLPPEAADLTAAPFLEFGWGDRAFYMAADPTAWLALRAALAPTPAVLHVDPLPRPPSGATADVIRLDLSEAAFAALAAALSQAFERSDAMPAGPIALGLGPGARFYAARGRFHLFNTCNTWVAGLLSEAGVDIGPAGVVTAEDLMRRVRAAGPRAPGGRGRRRARPPRHGAVGSSP